MEHYATLGVSADAAEDDIRSAYKALALKWHPDRQLQNSGEATSKFVQVKPRINDAYKGVLRERRRAQRKSEKPEQTPEASTSQAACSDPPKVAEDPPELITEPFIVPVHQHCETSSSSSATSTSARGSGSSSSHLHSSLSSKDKALDTKKDHDKPYSSSSRSSSSHSSKNKALDAKKDNGESHSSSSRSSSSHSSKNKTIDTKKDNGEPHSSSSRSSSSHSSKDKVLDTKMNHEEHHSSSPTTSQTSSPMTSVASLFDDHRSAPTRGNRTPSQHASRYSLSSSSTTPSSTSAASSHHSTSSKPSPATTTTPPRACVYTYYSASSDDHTENKDDHPQSARSSVHSTWSFCDAGNEILPDVRFEDRHSSHSAKPGPSQRDGNNNDHHAEDPQCSFSKADPGSAHRSRGSEKSVHERSTHSSSRSSVKSESSTSSSINSDATSVYTATVPIVEMPGVPRNIDDSHSSIKSGSKLRKQSKPPDHRTDKTNDSEDRSDRVILPEYDPPLLRESGGPKEWVYPLTLSLEEMYKGKKLRFRVIRYKLSGKKKNVILDFNVPTGCPNGTKIVFKGCGHELEDGTKQDVIFLVEEAKHDKFIRDHDDLIMDVRLPWLESLNEERGEVHLNGIDGKPLHFDIDFAKHKSYLGATAIPDAGMPRRDGSGRGNLVVR
ncbi:hypothetical protein BDQ17DRAFT_1424988 [Cyathus striatus]|nr:hypothetical protein BDQ17DRAFT_1424988 [Cyathus striatus]